MDLMRIIREAGVGGYASIGFGLLGAVLGCFAVLALSAKNRSAFSLGIATLVIGVATAAAGMLGTVYIRYQVRSAVASVSSGLDMERILREGFREAQSSSWIGFFAALIPLALGGVAALLGSRLQAPRARIQGFAEPTVSSDESAGQSVVAGIFLCLTVFACGGAWAMAHSELPRVRYSFEITDFDAWALANALEDMKELKAQQPNGCERLQEALRPYWGATDKKEWPRKMRTISPELSAWRGMADACTERTLQALDDRPLGEEEIALVTALLESPLLQSDELRTRLTDQSPHLRMASIVVRTFDENEPRHAAQRGPIELAFGG